MQLGFYFDQTRCSGCDTCIVACKDWHDVPAGPASWMRVKTFEKGSYPELYVGFLAEACYHCAKPACAAACPYGAIVKREKDGIVEVDRDKCIGKDGCGLCLEACPYSAPQFGSEDNPTMQKCDLCAERWSEGKKPICVEACPMRALDAGPIDELKKKYGDIRNAEGFTYDEKLRPAVIFKPRLDKKNLKLVKTILAPYTVGGNPIE